MKTKNLWVMVGVIGLVIGMGCGEAPHSQGAGAPGGDWDASASVWELEVDIDNRVLTISDASRDAGGGLAGPQAFTQIGGHPLEVRNGPAGCAWEAATGTATCEIAIRNLDADECMHQVRTRLNGSTDPSAIMVGADYVWPGPTVVPNTAQPIDESGYCFTETSPDSGGSSEGCQNTWQDNIPPGAIAAQNLVFTNVLVGNYRVYLQIFAGYQACSAPAGMVRVPAGCFDMGDALGEGDSNELPVHNVCLTSDFFMGVHEVTNQEYAACVGGGGCAAPGDSSSSTRPSYYGDPAYNDFPVIYVGWDQAMAYCTWAGGRLPTEAEWEYAARGGLSGKRYPWWGDGAGGADANYWDSVDAWDNDTSPVKNYEANDYGLYDMSGNVWEWTNDWYFATYYGAGPVDDPSGPASGASRVLRGGSWQSPAGDLSLSVRSYQSPTIQNESVGFRCAEATPDTRPLVILTNPADLAAAVPFNTTVTAEFSEAMDPATIVLPATFTLKAGSTVVAGTVTYGGLMATFTPSEPLAPLTTYTATITTGARDLAGNALLSNFVWTFTTAPAAANSPAPVALREAADFAILAGSAISSVPACAITGDVGLSPAAGGFITGLTCPEVSGTIYQVDNGLVAVCAQTDPAWLAAAKAALTDAFNDAAERTLPASTTISGDQGGVTLSPGIYQSTSSLAIGAGNLTLDAQGDPNAVWIFQIGSTLTTVGCGSGCTAQGNVVLKNGANPANVFWQVGSSASIGSYTTFNGTILAYASITITTGTQINGRLLAGTGAVTLGQNAVIKP